MASEHDHYDELAVGHVLGGLDAAAAAEFRSHLTSCRECRRRVAELRDIAAELAAAERDERERARVRTETTRRAEEDQPDPPVGRRRPGLLAVGVLAVLVLFAGLAFWNLHLRTTTEIYAEVAERRGDALQGLAAGTALEASYAGGITGLVSGDGEHVAFSFANLPALAAGERLAVWLVTGAGEEEAALALIVLPGQLDDEVLAARLADRGAAELVITLERGDVASGPSGRELVRVRLRAAAAGAGD